MKKILLIRSSTLLFEKMLNQFEGQEVELTALVASPIEAKSILDKGVKEIIYLENEDGFKLKYLFGYKKQLEGSKFDEVICLYNNKSGNGYLNVDLFSLITPSHIRKAINYDREEISLSYLYVLKKFLRLASGYFWIAINSLLGLIILALIFLGMLIVEIVHFFTRFLASKKVAP